MKCLACDYDLRALCEHRCPECGAAFDPADESTFTTGREYWPLAKVARGYAIALAAMPYIFVAFAYATWIAGRLSIGHWPRPNIDKAARITWTVPIVLGGLGLSFAAIATAAFSAACALVASLFIRKGIVRSLLVLLFCAATGACFIPFVRWDPHGVFDWIFD